MKQCGHFKPCDCDMQTYTDTQLKQALAKMLPDVLEPKWVSPTAIGANINDKYFVIWWKGKATAVLDTELLHLCWLVEETLTPIESAQYCEYLQQVAEHTLNRDYKLCEWFRGKYVCTHATWQQRTIALAKVKGTK